MHYLYYICIYLYYTKKCSLFENGRIAIKKVLVTLFVS